MTVKVVSESDEESATNPVTNRNPLSPVYDNDVDVENVVEVDSNDDSDAEYSDVPDSAWPSPLDRFEFAQEVQRCFGFLYNLMRREGTAYFENLHSENNCNKDTKGTGTDHPNLPINVDTNDSIPVLPNAACPADSDAGEGPSAMGHHRILSDSEPVNLPSQPAQTLSKISVTEELQIPVDSRPENSNDSQNALLTSCSGSRDSPSVLSNLAPADSDACEEPASMDYNIIASGSELLNLPLVPTLCEISEVPVISIPENLNDSQNAALLTSCSGSKDSPPAYSDAAGPSDPDACNVLMPTYPNHPIDTGSGPSNQPALIRGGISVPDEVPVDVDSNPGNLNDLKNAASSSDREVSRSAGCSQKSSDDRGKKKRSESSDDPDRVEELESIVVYQRHTLMLFVCLMLEEYCTETPDFDKMSDLILGFKIMVDEHTRVRTEFNCLETSGEADENKLIKLRQLFAENEKYIAVAQYGCLFVHVHGAPPLIRNFARGLSSFR